MTNWCYNKLIVMGPDIPSLLDKIGTSEIVFSFNKIIPMPEALKIACGSYEENALSAVMKAAPERVYQAVEEVRKSHLLNRIHLWTINCLIDKHDNGSLFANMEKDLSSGIFMSDYFQNITNEQNHKLAFADLVELGNIYLDNLRDYGCLDWSDWRRMNWGPTYDLDASTSILFQDEHALILIFVTAWLPPRDVIREMGIQFPEYKFQLLAHESGNGISCRLDVFGENLVYKDLKSCPRGLYSNNCRTSPDLIWKREKRKRPYDLYLDNSRM